MYHAELISFNSLRVIEKGEIIKAEAINLQKRERWVRTRERYNGNELFDMNNPKIKGEKPEK
jgi:hypothetical protein